ncbi:MAG: 50S ribosomal protein L15 [Candidatus Taylorbacteria bacterium CG10_big_fil_rev_8_21_14_0_10_41_48]|uniref:Large ribosomal subunit protein uL15 n=1 Tax=Candidatus Taylorbacteria bacterium CG10_big_fil_rev_8_21_14_0_10_41_48 TaxID=1975024 RepID=A0A2M8LCS8_9BACT|nr:MAG: 50S ribosomal protein L15 [Candidatus Taylorbacteria bacterium CG10_big_fil_rev_8_21_14_0_10_41_48]
MQIHELARKTPNKKAPLRGRGGKRGKTSGRGTKGQDSRAGRKKRPELRDFIKRVPKLRGYAFNSIVDKMVPVSLAMINERFESGDRVEPKTIAAKKIVVTSSGRYPKMKILSDGEVTKKFIVSGISISKGAKDKIEKAGGTVHA